MGRIDDLLEIKEGFIYILDAAKVLNGLHHRTHNVKVLSIEERQPSRFVALVESIETGKKFHVATDHLQVSPEVLKKELARMIAGSSANMRKLRLDQGKVPQEDERDVHVISIEDEYVRYLSLDGIVRSCGLWCLEEVTPETPDLYLKKTSSLEPAEHYSHFVKDMSAYALDETVLGDYAERLLSAMAEAKQTNCEVVVAGESDKCLIIRPNGTVSWVQELDHFTILTEEELPPQKFLKDAYYEIAVKNAQGTRELSQPFAEMSEALEYAKRIMTNDNCTSVHLWRVTHERKEQIQHRALLRRIEELFVLSEAEGSK